MKPNCSGYATKYGVKCSDGRTILADAFSHEDKKRVPIMWRHDPDGNPENVLGYAILEHESGVGVRSDLFFNDTPRGSHAKNMIEHGDLDSLSIKAVRLKQNGTDVTYGDLVEVSLVPVGANKDARIDSVFIEHEDGIPSLIDGEAIIYSGDTLTHEDGSEESYSDSEEAEESDQTAQEVYDSMTDEQKALVEAMLIIANGEDGENSDEDSSEDNTDISHEGEQTMPRNVFDQKVDKAGEKAGTSLSHEDALKLLKQAMNSGSSLRDTMLAHADEGGLVGPYGVTNIEELFPEPKLVTDRPDWIKRDTSWVDRVLGGVHTIPFSRIKSMTADITHEEARAKGYIKGTRKKNEFFAVKSRTTEPKTIYKRQGFDRDDLIDATTFDVVSWVKTEMEGMLREEMARAILFGDGRAVDDPDKIDETKIRPVATDDEFYTAKLMINSGQSAKDLATTILRSRKLIRGGTGKPTLFTHSDLVIDLLLMEDKLGRRYYDTTAALAAALNVADIVECEVLEEGYTDDDGNVLLGVIVNLNDYDFGNNPLGKETMFDAFDIDFNQLKYLIETRRAGALVRHRSAISLWENAGTTVRPEAPLFDADSGTVLVTSTAGVRYYGWTGTNEAAPISSEWVIPAGETGYIEARPATGYTFPFNTVSNWSFTA